MCGVTRIDTTGWTERFMVHSANPSCLQLYALSHTGAAYYHHLLQTLRDVPDIHFIDNDLQPYSCH